MAGGGMPILMRIRIVKGEYVWCPRVVCDHCGEEILDARDGKYLWAWGENPSQGSSLFFTHKKCFHAFESRHTDVLWGTEELVLFSVFLKNNLSK